MAVRGRYQFNNKTKEWGIYYKPYRNEWILMLLTVNERLFALQIPKVIPGKIKAQYEEQEAIAEMKQSLARGEVTFKAAEGVDRRYLSIKDEKQKNFVRNPDKKEANIAPDLDSTVKFEAPKLKSIEKNPYDQVIN